VQQREVRRAAKMVVLRVRQVPADSALLAAALQTGLPYVVGRWQQSREFVSRSVDARREKAVRVRVRCARVRVEMLCHIRRADAEDAPTRGVVVRASCVRAECVTSAV